MKKIFIVLGIYLIFIIGIIFILVGKRGILEQINGCLPYDPYHSFLTEWLDINYFDERKQYESCMNAPDIYGLYRNLEEKSASCKDWGKLGVCGSSNYKPGIVYITLGIILFILGMLLKKKHIQKK